MCSPSHLVCEIQFSTLRSVYLGIYFAGSSVEDEKMRFKEETPGIYTATWYTSNESASIVERLKHTAKWTEAQVRQHEAGGDLNSVRRPEVRKANVVFYGRRSKLYEDFTQKLNRIALPIIEQVWQLRLSAHDGLQAVRYLPGDHYRAHADASLDLTDRYFTILCYLNDDFNGGHTWFPSLNHSITPKRGKMIVFPAAFIHQAQPVLAGEKYVLVAWVVGPKTVNWI